MTASWNTAASRHVFMLGLWLGMAGCRVTHPASSDLQGTWRHQGSTSSVHSGTLELVADGTCRPDAAFIAFVASCNGRGIQSREESCHWGQGTDTQPDEVQVVLAADGGFLGLRMGGWRPFPGTEIRLLGRCVDGGEYTLSK